MDDQKELHGKVLSLCMAVMEHRILACAGGTPFGRGCTAIVWKCSNLLRRIIASYDSQRWL